jgi:hypothetical protein
MKFCRLKSTYMICRRWPKGVAGIACQPTIFIFTPSISGGVQKATNGMQPETVFFVGHGVQYALADSKTRWQHCKQRLMQRAVNACLKSIKALTTNTNGAAQEATYGQLAAGMFLVDLGVQYVPGALKIP